MARHRVCLLCAEREPLDCHRCLLVGRALAERGLALGHIRADGTIEPHAATEQRLLALTDGETDLFREPAERLAHAIAGARRPSRRASRLDGNSSPSPTSPMGDVASVSAAFRLTGASQSN
jgi:hypothetical protein